VSTLTDVALVVVGGLLTQGGSIVTQLLQKSSDKQRRAEEREAAAAEAAKAFQRETLLELQEALQRQMRSVGRAWYEDITAWRSDGPPARWRGQLLNPETNNELHQAGVTVLLLMERVADDEARGLVKETHNRISLYESSQTADAGWDRMSEANKVFERANERIGQVLRTLL